MEYVAEYQQVSRDYNLSQTQKMQFLHNIVRGDAIRFYLSRVDNEATNFNQAVTMIESEYNSFVRQNRIKNYLNCQRINKLANEGVDKLAALKKCISLLRSYRSRFQHRIEVMHIESNSYAVQPWDILGQLSHLVG